MIQGVNLIPAHRRVAQLWRRRTRSWGVAVAIYALAIGGVWAGAHVVWSGSDRALARDLAEVNTQLEDAQRMVTQLRPRLAEAQTTLAATRSVGTKPDWSLLLGVLARLLGEETVLTACELEPVITAAPTASVKLPGQDAKPSAVGPSQAVRRYVLRLRGLGRTQSAVSDYVLRLEQAGLFEKVTLIDTRTEPFMDGHAVAFRVECLLGGAKEVTP